MDVRVSRTLLAGVAATRFGSRFGWTERGDGEEFAGSHRSRITGVHPYLGWTPSAGARMWATAGFGTGRIDIEDGAAGRQSSAGSVKAFAAGNSVRLFADGEGAGSTTLRLKADGHVARMEVRGNGDLIEGVAVGVHRLRAVVEAVREFGVGRGKSLVPSIAFGARRDGGDGAAGTGAELSGRLDFSDRAAGLAVEANGRLMLWHTGGTREWGVGAAITLDPRLDGRGLSLRVTPRLGASDEGVERLWEEGAAGPGLFGDASALAAPRSEAEVGYGLPVCGGRCVFTPYSGFGLGGGHADYRIGGRFDFGVGIDLASEAARCASPGSRPDHLIGIRLHGSW